MLTAQNLDPFAEYRQQLALPMADKVPLFQRENRLEHLVFADQLTVELLNKLRRSADTIRQLSRSQTGANMLRGLLSHKRAMLYFTQPSTRTFLSFMAACQILGMTCNEVRDPKISSEAKRESPLDSIRMFSSYFDAIIMRSARKDYAECCAFLMTGLRERGKRWVPIINGGSGADEHPTQALLDMYTIMRTFEFSEATRHGTTTDRLQRLRVQYPGLQQGPQGKTYCFCGDIGRGRTVRSLAKVLAMYPGVKMFFVSPNHPTLMIDSQLQDHLNWAGVECHSFHSLDAEFEGTGILEQIDCLYMTRIQREHNTPQEAAEFEGMNVEDFRLTPQRLQHLKSYVPIMHPFPRDSQVGEIPPEIDHDPRVMYFRQARNGMWARASLLVHIFKLEHQLEAMSRDLSGSDQFGRS